jgi:hypothetical protein
MKSYVSSHLQGGLGNYLFQISAAYAVSIRDNKELKIDVSDIAIVHSPLELYSNNIFRNISFGNIDNFEQIHQSNHIPISYINIPVVKGNLKLDGYYQNEKYFKEYRDDVLKLFEIDDSTKNYIIEKYSDIQFKNTCSIHVRRGNYVERQHFHSLQTIEYYKKSISIIGEKTLFLIFSDDIEWCKVNLDFIENKIFISGNLDYQDLYLMSMCNHNIIANSSFSWWGAWLNNRKDKKIIYPSVWFNNGPDTSQIGGENWIKV